MTTAAGTGSPRPDRLLLTLSEASLVVLTIAAAVGLGRALADWSFVAPVVATAVAAHGLAIACRRLGFGPVTAGFLSVVGLLPVLALVHLRTTTFLGLPTPETLHVLGRELANGWRAFGEVKPPAPVLPGFVAAGAIATWFVAFSADAAAFRARAQLESVVPATAMFVFGAALDGRRARIPVTALFFAALLASWLTQRSLERTSSLTWMARDTRRGVRAILRLGGALTVIGVAVASLVGPKLPGADATPVIPWRSSDRDHGSSRITVSPLVDIKNRIVDEADNEVFTVRSPIRSYWRLTSLERFDGRIWSSNRSYRKASGTLGADVDTRAIDAGATLIDQDFQIESLASIWLPAAFRPAHITGTAARYDADSNSLLTEHETAAGAAYSVTSAIAHLTADQLRAVPAVAPEALAKTYLALPAGFSPAVQRLAQRVVTGKRTQYDRARALQDFFQSPPFVYDLHVPQGHGANALEDFLFKTQRGYCEQYSGAFAAMARAVGLPARVAVGFTAGEGGPDGLIHVRGRNGHAWPEVYFQGYGWVPFEPTPGRGIPGAQQYTNIPERQASAGDPSTATTLAPTTTTEAPDAGVTSTTAQRDETVVPPEKTSTAHRWFERALIAVAILLALPTAWALIVTTVRRRQRLRRRAAAATTNERVLVAWTEVDEALARTGVGRRPWETPIEFAHRASTRKIVDDELLRELARAASAAAYSSRVLSDDTAEEAAAAAGRIEDAADASLDRRGRLRLLFDPRPLFPERRQRVEVRETAGR